MRPTPIPSEEVWEGGQRVVYSAPNGDLTDPAIAPVETVVDRSTLGGLRISVRCTLEDGDLEKLAAGGHVWISFAGLLPPFSLDVKAPGE